MSAKKFNARIGTEGGGHFIEVPFDVKEEFGRARQPVKASVNGHGYRTTIAVYGAKYYLGLRKADATAAGVKAGDIVKVTIEPDTQIRTVVPPPDLAAAFKKNAAARARWEKLSYSHKKEHAEAILKSKKPETRTRRVQKTMEMLSAKMK
jgi:hypothetical protein